MFIQIVLQTTRDSTCIVELDSREKVERLRQETVLQNLFGKFNL